MSALEKLTSSTAWGTVSAVMKDRLAQALASGDTSTIIDLTSRMGASAAAQSSEEEAPAQPYRQAVSQRQWKKEGAPTIMANGVGVNILYQPTANEWPTGYYQHAAIITGWDELKQLANLIVFSDGVAYTVAKNQVVEGTDDGSFQQLGHAITSGRDPAAAPATGRGNLSQAEWSEVTMNKSERPAKPAHHRPRPVSPSDLPASPS